MNDNLTKLNFRFERSKLLRTKLNWKLMKLNEEVTKMGGKTYIINLHSYGNIMFKDIVNSVEARFKKMVELWCLCCIMMFKWTNKQLLGMQKFWEWCSHYEESMTEYHQSINCLTSKTQGFILSPYWRHRYHVGPCSSDFFKVETLLNKASNDSFHNFDKTDTNQLLLNNTLQTKSDMYQTNSLWRLLMYTSIQSYTIP